MHHLSRSRTDARVVLLIAAFALALSLAATLTFANGVHAAATATLAADLTAEAEVPSPGPDGATGTALITAGQGGEVCYELTIGGLDEGDVVVAAHLHLGAAGVVGQVEVTLFDETPAGEMAGCVQAPLLIVDEMATGVDYYVNIHTSSYPDGAVRGQLELVGVAGDCTLRVSVGGGEPSETLSVDLGETVLVSGSLDFMGNNEVEFTYFRDGQVSSSQTLSGDDIGTDGVFEFPFQFDFDDGGTWVFQAVVAQTGCTATAGVTVEAPAAPTQAPLLPNTAVDVSPTDQPGWTPAVAVALLLGMAGLRLLRRQGR